MRLNHQFYRRQNPGRLLSAGKARILLFVFVSITTMAFSQSYRYRCGELRINYQDSLPDNYNYFDRFGNRYTQEDIAYWPQYARGGGPCDLIEDFELVFVEDAGVFTVDERETICEVFTYLSGLINAPSGQRAVIRIEKDDLDEDIGAIGTPFFQRQCGFGHTMVHRQLFAGNMNFQEHGRIFINTDLDNFYTGPENGIANNQVDLYTVVLHEALHVLGFASQITQTGAPAADFYTLWDLNLVNPDNERMILTDESEDPACCFNYEFNDADFPGMPNLIWNQNCQMGNVGFDIAQFPPVNGEYPNAPQDDPTFMNVLSHLDQTCAPAEHFVMQAGILTGAAGVQRVLTVPEVGILCGLGYDVTEECNTACITLATNDGHFIVAQGGVLTIDFENLLANDFPNDAVLNFLPDCGDHDGITIDFDEEEEAFVIQADEAGFYTFCYSITACDNNRCDVARLTILVTNPNVANACENVVGCNINPLGDFELFESEEEMQLTLALGMGNEESFNFFENIPLRDNSPDLIVNVPVGLLCGDLPTPAFAAPQGNQMARIVIRHFEGINAPEGMGFPLCRSILPGMAGTVTFLAMAPAGCTALDPEVVVEFSENPPVAGAFVYTNPSMSSNAWHEPITSTQNTNPVFREYTVNFENDTEDCWNFLYLSSFTETPTPLGAFGSIFIDDVRVNVEENLADFLDINVAIAEEEPCLGGEVEVEIEICNVSCGMHPGTEIIPVLPDGLVVIPNADFPNGVHILDAGEVAPRGCDNLILLVQVEQNIDIINTPLAIDLLFSSVNTCFEDVTIEAGTVTPQSKEATVTCETPKPAEICAGHIVEVIFPVCVTMAMGLEVLVTPEVELPAGWTLANGTPAPFVLPKEGCQDIVLQIEVPVNAPLNTSFNVVLNGTAIGLCTAAEWSFEAVLTVIDCEDPVAEFTCPCTAGGLNIDASANSPYYDAALGGVLYSVLEANFNYDANNDGTINASEHSNCIAINGRLVVNQNLRITGCSNIQMQPCSEIVVGTASTQPDFWLISDVIHACTTMWHGITVQPSASLRLRSNTIRDAQFAVDAQGSNTGNPLTRLLVSGNTFSNNHVGIFFSTGTAQSVEHFPLAGNTFNTTANLLLPCNPTLPNYENLQGYAGIATLGTALTVGSTVPGPPINTFQSLRNGIVSEGSVLSVYRANFQNIIGLNIAGAPSFANSSGNGVAANGGVVIVQNSNFNTVRRGVYAHQNPLVRVQGNTMAAMWRGIDVTGANSTDISNNPDIGFANRGIVCRDLIPAIAPSEHRIFNNENLFTMAFPGGTSNPFGPYPAAIEIDHAQSIDIGEGLIRENHFSNGGFLSDGIRINGSGNWNIVENIIDFLAPAASNFSNIGTGILLTNTANNYLYGNTITDVDPTSPASAGLGLSIGTGNLFCCNTTSGNAFGSRFMGGCGNTKWRATNMQNHKSALHCSSGTVIGPQTSHGNIFGTNSGTAFHGGSVTEILLSQFRVVNMSLPHWPISINTPNASGFWFNTGGNAPGCVAPCVPLPLAPGTPGGELKEEDEKTAEKVWESSEYGEALQWESERQLYEKMSRYEALSGVDATVDSFYMLATGDKIGAYYLAEKNTKEISWYPAAVQDSLQEILLQLNDNLELMQEALEDLAGASNEADSLLIYDLVNSIQESQYPIANKLHEWETKMRAFRTARAFNALALTRVLSDDHILEENRRTVQAVYLQTLGLGIPSLNTEQMSLIEPIALQCPLEGGSAVYAARALYRLNDDRIFYDDSLCNMVEERRQILTKPATYGSVLIAPNPAADMITVSGLPVMEDRSVLVSVLNTNGVVCWEKKVDSETVQLSVATMPSGIYFFRIRIGSEAPMMRKVAISH